MFEVELNDLISFDFFLERLRWSMLLSRECDLSKLSFLGSCSLEFFKSSTVKYRSKFLVFAYVLLYDGSAVTFAWVLTTRSYLLNGSMASLFFDWKVFALLTLSPW